MLSWPGPMQSIAVLCTQHSGSASAKRQLEKKASISTLIFVGILEALCRLCISGLEAKLRSKDSLFMDSCQLERIAAFRVPKRAILPKRPYGTIRFTLLCLQTFASGPLLKIARHLHAKLHVGTDKLCLPKCTTLILAN